MGRSLCPDHGSWEVEQSEESGREVQDGGHMYTHG